MNKGVLIASALAFIILVLILLSEKKSFSDAANEIEIDADWNNRHFSIKYSNGQHAFVAPATNTHGVYLRTSPTLGYRVLNDGEIVEIFFSDKTGLLKSIYANFLTKQFQPEYQSVLQIPNQNG